MRIPCLLAVLAALTVPACGPSRPDLDARISPAARSAPFPALQPLGPLLAQSESVLPQGAEGAGETLEARAADLRRRAAILRAIPL